jgi:hypothetical protein
MSQLGGDARAPQQADDDNGTENPEIRLFHRDPNLFSALDLLMGICFFKRSEHA